MAFQKILWMDAVDVPIHGILTEFSPAVALQNFMEFDVYLIVSMFYVCVLSVQMGRVAPWNS